MKAMNMEAYRFSISWSRVIPHGKRRRGLSTEGLEFYDKVIDRTIAAGMKPYVTIFHWDTPQALVDEYGGFLSRNIVDDFRDYADLLFERYGDKVEKWITLNEPWTYVVKGFEEGVFAPGRCSDWVNRACQAGDSAVEPYRVAHHLLLAHAEAVKLYREKEGRKLGEIGITLVTFWFEPYSDSQADNDAAERAMDFMFGWFMNPVTYGHYPRTMKDLLGQRLPEILAHEADMLRNSYDFLGLNYYTTYYAKDNPNLNLLKLRYATDSRVIQTPIKDGKPIGEKVASSWLYIYPEGIRKLLSYTKRTYGSPIIYITENGVSEEDDPTTSIVEATNDKRRIKYYHKHLHNVLEANKTDKVDVRGYFAWSYADNFEWADGYTSRFGLYYIDFKDPKFARIPKSSACWFKRFLQTPSPHASQDNDDQELILLPVSGIVNRALPRALRFSY
ncbi:unnamed protein product [Linum tenue]|uniref:Uncharacterized protein n=1 Tax=Linum tenue TaxID=586396 RepID=A0AAV0II25_9ROSI|nr:unnamed protein product [Linum tenue]